MILLLSSFCIALIITQKQHEIFEKIKFFVLTRDQFEVRLSFRERLPAGDRAFIVQLSTELGIKHGIEVKEVDGVSQKSLYIEWDDEDDEDDEESFEARQRVLRKYDSASIVDEKIVAEDKEETERRMVEEQFIVWKRDYYKVSFCI